MALQALHIKLDSGDSEVEMLPESIEHAYLGGRGLAAWMLATRLPVNAAPLSKANLLIFSTGPLSGTTIPSTGGFVISTRSPLTGAMAHSWSDGSWGTALRTAGYDALVIDGQNPDWCIIVIDGPYVGIEPADDLAGLDTLATEQALRKRLGHDVVVACLGPAGEAGVAYSTVVAEGRFAAAPAGPGAVMAHKRIKAIVVRRKALHAVADATRVQTVLEAIETRINTSQLATGIKLFGSNYYLPFAKEWGALTGRNGQDGRIEHIQLLSRTSVAQRGKREAFCCENCLLPSHSHYLTTHGDPVAYPELEAVAGFGGSCGIASADALITINNRCLRLGLDVSATSAAIAFFMECQQEGLSRAGTLPWGDADAVLDAIERLGERREKRDLLSLGVGEMQEVFYGSSAFAPQVNGLAMPALDPRAFHELALATATSPIGGDYRYAMTFEEMLVDPPSWLPDEPSHPQAVKGKAVRLIWHERFAASLDAAGVCRRLALMAYQLTPGELNELIAGGLGWAMSPQELARLGERIITLERLFALERGVGHWTDRLPRRWNETALMEGRAAGHLPNLEDMLPEYYRRHGWDAEGVPTSERLNQLGIHVEN